MERAFWLLDRKCSFNGVNTSRIRGPLTESVVRSALNWVQARHPQLRVHIEGHPLQFVADARPLSLRIVERESTETWRAVEHDELNRRYESGDLLSRAVLVRGDEVSELIISHQHVIADAQSAVIMAREIVEAAGAVAAGNPLPPPTSFELRAPLETLLRATLPWWKRILAMNLFFFRHLFTKIFRRPTKLAIDQAAGFSDRRLAVHHRALSPAQTRQLAARARKLQTTVQGALGAAMLVTSADERPPGAKVATFGCFSGVSLRHHFQLGEEMGLYVSQVSTYHSAPQEFWTLAREVKEALKRTLTYGDQYVTLPMMGMFIPRKGSQQAVVDKFAARFDLGAPATVGVTNIGAVGLPRFAGPLELESFEISVGPSVVAPLIAAVSTFRDQLSLSIVYVEPLISSERAGRFADDVVARLSAAATSSEPST